MFSGKGVNYSWNVYCHRILNIHKKPPFQPLLTHCWPEICFYSSDSTDVHHFAHGLKMLLKGINNSKEIIKHSENVMYLTIRYITFSECLITIKNDVHQSPMSWRMEFIQRCCLRRERCGWFFFWGGEGATIPRASLMLIYYKPCVQLYV